MPKQLCLTVTSSWVPYRKRKWGTLELNFKLLLPCITELGGKKLTYAIWVSGSFFVGKIDLRGEEEEEEVTSGMSCALHGHFRQPLLLLSSLTRRGQSGLLPPPSFVRGIVLGRLNWVLLPSLQFNCHEKNPAWHDRRLILDMFFRG